VADPRLSIIIPTLNEAGTLPATLAALQSCRRQGHEVIVVDGGSRDATPALAHPLADRVCHTAPGRAIQMQSGAAVARGSILWFLHADTLPPADAARAIIRALATGKYQWGYFRVRFPGASRSLGLVAALMNIRSRLSRIATGDQGIFVTRELFTRVTGFPLIPLMEDIALTRTLKRHAPRVCLDCTLTTSARRWRRHGTLRTILLMWALRSGYFFGISPQVLAKYYRTRSA
jgi:rSAM/selenodomain-associated transferase 2